jgi:hypothetical protein
MAIERKPENDEMFALERLINPTRSAEGPTLPPRLQGPMRVPIVRRLQLLRTQSYSGGTQFTLVWDDPEENQDLISHFNVYVLGLLDDNQIPSGPYSTQRSPAEVRVTTRVKANVTLIVQTVLKSGLTSDMNISPSVSGETVVSTLTSGDYPDETVPLSALDPWGTLNYILSGNGASSAPTWKSRGTLDLIEGRSTLAVSGAPVVSNGSGQIREVDITDIDNTDSPYTQLATDWLVLCDASGGAITVNLLTAVAADAREITIKKTDSSANAVTVDPNGTETIEGETDGTITLEGESWTLRSDGANWRLV